MGEPQSPDLDLLAVFKELLDEAANPEKSLTLNDVDFDQIALVRAEIEYTDERLKSGKVRKVRKRNAIFRREALASRLVGLESGHDKIAKSLQVKAQALGALPREMRDAIFEQLYRSKTPISAEILRFGPKTLFKMPKDSALYMSQRHVGPVIADEAAEIFYTQNTFDFGGGRTMQNTLQWCREKYDLFLDSDHYASGVRPRDLIRKVRIVLSDAGRSSYAGALRFEYDARRSHPRQINFEREFHEWLDRSNSKGNQFFDDREHLEYFLGFGGLQELTIVIGAVSNGNYDSICRLINPVVRELKERRVKVMVINYQTIWQVGNPEVKVHEQDVSSFFDTPSPDDYAHFHQKHPAPIFVFDPKTDPLEAWWTWAKTKDWDIVGSIYQVDYPQDFDNHSVLLPLPQAGLLRVWYHEAYEVFKFYKEHRVVVDKLNEMWDELKSFSAEEVGMRKRYYGRMMELMTQQR